MMDDMISRQAAIDAIRASTKKYTGFMEMEMYTDDDAVEAIEGLPSAEPESKERPLTEDDYAYCAECDHVEMCRWYPMYGCEFKSRPSAQPEITHCAECIHWKHSAIRKSYCEVFDWTNKAEDFCSFAERKDDEE